MIHNVEKTLIRRQKVGWADNFKTQEVKMINKVLREKSNCVVCRSSKSRFLKQKHNSKK